MRKLLLPLSWKPWLDGAGWGGLAAFALGLGGSSFTPPGTYNEGVRALFLLAAGAGAALLAVRGYLTRLEYYDRLHFVSYEREAALVRERRLRLPAPGGGEGAMREGNDGRYDTAAPPLHRAWRICFVVSLALFGGGVVMSYPTELRALANNTVVCAVVVLSAAAVLRGLGEFGRLVRLQRADPQE